MTDRRVYVYLDLRSDPTLVGRLWVFNVLVSNTDDHLRNHAFLYAGPDGWRLSPAYDLNPTPVELKARVLTTTITWDHDPTASLELALGVASEFGLDTKRAARIAFEVGQAVTTWREEAARHGLTTNETDLMASAFEHDDLRQALAGR